MSGIVIDRSAAFARRRLEAEMDRLLALIEETQHRTEAGRRRCEELLRRLEADVRNGKEPGRESR